MFHCHIFEPFDELPEAEYAIELPHCRIGNGQHDNDLEWAKQTLNVEVCCSALISATQVTQEPPSQGFCPRSLSITCHSPMQAAAQAAAQAQVPNYNDLVLRSQDGFDFKIPPELDAL